MKRTSLIVAGVLACLSVVSVGTAAAESQTPHVYRECFTTSNDIQGGTAKVIVKGTHVSRSQAKLASCVQAEKIFWTATEQRLEVPHLVHYFRCIPGVLSTGPDVVRYDCRFQSADTSTHIDIGFTVTYD